MKKAILFVCLAFSVLLLSWFCAPFEANGEPSSDLDNASENNTPVLYALPSEASNALQALTREPFPTPCGQALTSIRIDSMVAHLVFGDPPSFSVALADPRTVSGRGKTTKTFLVFTEDGVCPRAVDDVARVLEEREGESIFIQIKTTNDRNTGDKTPQVHDMTIKADVDIGDLIVQSFFSFFLLFSCVFITLQTIKELRKIFEDACVGRTTERKYVLLTVAFSFFVFAFGLLWDLLPINWYPVIYPDYRYRYISFVFVQIQPFLSRIGIVPEQMIGVLVNLAGALCVILSYLAARRFVSSRRSVLVASIMAFLPRLIMFYTSDCQHVLSLAVWLWGLLQWLDWRSGERKALFKVLLSLTLLPLIRIETAWWIVLWGILLPPRINRRKFFWLFANMVIYGVMVVLILKAIGYGTFDFSTLPTLPIVPLNFLRLLVESDVLYLFLLTSFLWGGWVFFIEDRNFLLRMYVILCLSFFSGAITGRTSEEFVTFRYYFVGLFPLVLLIATGMEGIYLRLVQKINRGTVLFALLSLLFVEGVLIFSKYELQTYQQEYLFIKETFPKLTPGKTVCSISSDIHYHLDEQARDLDVSLYLPSQMKDYFGFDLQWKLLVDDRETDCDYYYETSLCQMRFSDDLLRVEPNLKKNMGNYYRLCDLAQERFGKELVHQKIGTQKIYFGSCREKSEREDNILLRLYKTEQ